MKKAARVFSLLTLSCMVLPAMSQKAGLTFDNQVSSWVNMNLADTIMWQAGVRYIPTLSPWLKTGEKSKIDAELSFKIYGNLNFSDLSYESAGSDFKPYRLWLRYSSSNLEIRAGLQKINFGSALVFRPLMWFDRMDFRDPLQLTDGVYGLLGRYYFNNNVNIWLWGLYGNDSAKGWEITPSVKEIPEYGGRLQVPFFRGEMAFSYHNREADYSELLAGIPMVNVTEFTEQSFAVDGKWDIGIGFWFEYMKKLNAEDNPVMSRWETYYSIGADYTIGLGNGLNITTEYFHYANNPEDQVQESKRDLITLSLSYPLSVTHNLSGVVYYDTNSKEWFRFMNLQMSWDYVSLYIMGYWNPETMTLYSGSSEGSLFTGKGIQLMLVLDI